MTPEEVVAALIAGTITKTEAVQRLVALGYNEEDAQEQIFIALGGDDVVDSDAQRRKNLEIARRK